MRYFFVLLSLAIGGCSSLADHLDKPGATLAQRDADESYCHYKATLSAASGSDMDRVNVEEQCMLYEKGYQRTAGRED